MENQARIKVVGIGDAGNNLVNRMIEEKVKNVKFLEINTDMQTLNRSKTMNVLQIGKLTTKGIGCGSDASLGARAVAENREEIKQCFGETDMIFLVAGMGGGTGTGSISYIASLAREMGILTIAIVTTPFSFEGRQRSARAQRGIEELKRYVDGLIIISNDELMKTTKNNITLKSAFGLSDNVLKQGIQSITDLIMTTGNINIDFADVRTIMKNKGGAYMGIGEAYGERAISEATLTAINNKITEIKIDGAKGVIINFAGNHELGLSEITESISKINDRIDQNAEIIFGTVIDETLGNKVIVTIIATGINEE